MYMEELLKSIQITVPSSIYVSDPIHTELGKKILKEGSILIAEDGIDNFTFKKLSKKIESTEAAIYRYFVNKHMLLWYYNAWYWKWMEYNFVFKSQNIESKYEKCLLVTEMLSNPPVISKAIEYIDGESLLKVIKKDGLRLFLMIKKDNEESDYSTSLKSFCDRFKKLIEELNPSYPFSLEMAFNIILSTHFNVDILDFLATDSKKKSQNDFWIDFINNRTSELR